MNNTVRDAGFFTEELSQRDPELFGSITSELGRQRDEIELIASENIVSKAVMQAQGSVMTNKYAEGYAGRRYYGGCQYVDIAETLAVDRAAKPNQSGKWFNAIQFGVRKEDNLLDYDQVQALATEHQPKMIIAGGSAVPRQIDFKRMREIADSVGAYLHVDMAHFAGLVAAGVHPSPFPYADVATTTTHKTLRGPRGGLILTNNEDLAKKFNSAIFPGIQGGPLMHVIAAKAVAFGEALRPEFKQYQTQVILNAKALADQLIKGGLDIVTGGTDTHVMLVDLRPKGVTGNIADKALGRAHITCNKNGIPFDPEKPMVTSGLRLGTPAGTTRGFGEAEFRAIADLIVEVLDGLAANGADGNADVEASVRAKVQKLCDQFPIYDQL